MCGCCRSSGGTRRGQRRRPAPRKPDVEGRPPELTWDAARCWRRLPPLPERPVGPALILLTGLAGAGKTTFAHRLAEVAPVVVISSDWERKTLIPSPHYTTKEDRRVSLASMGLVTLLLRRGYAVVCDGAHVSESIRRNWVYQAQRAGARWVVVELIALERWSDNG
ncbi:MAG: ATP-binding protein [Dehalococcoidia bacterium]|nr:ATP-binding protein [Dehalococcoidia bacterium]